MTHSLIMTHIFVLMNKAPLRLTVSIMSSLYPQFAPASFFKSIEKISKNMKYANLERKRVFKYMWYKK